jgi:small subunit ribosomal protein S1
MSEKTFEELLLEEEVSNLSQGKIFKGYVIKKSHDGIWVDLENTTGDVFVKTEELIKNISEYKLEEVITVKITKINDAEGFNTASEKRAIGEKIFRELNEGDIVNAKFDLRLDKGYGILIEDAVRAFLPGSLSLLKPEDDMPNNSIKMKVISKAGRRIVVSRRDFMEEQINDVYDNFKLNMIVEGVVESIKKFGVFVKLNDYVTALIPASEMSWDRNEKPENLFKEGSKVKGVIINIDKDERKISLSAKELKEDPWINLEQKYLVDSIVKGTVTKIFPFGFTVKLQTGVEGLVHESEVFWIRKGKISDVVSEGDLVEVKILAIDKEKRRLSLSYRQAIGNPWEDIEKNYKEDSIYDGVIEKILPNGAIIKLEEGLTGFLHVSELSWNFIDDINDAIKEEDTYKFKVLSIDKEHHKIKLSLKQAIENPWKKVIEEVKKDSVITGKIFRFTGKGAVVLINNYNVEAFLPGSKASLEKVDDIKNIFNIGDEVTAKVIDIEFENEEKRGNMIISVFDYEKELEKNEAVEEMKKLNEDN